MGLGLIGMMGRAWVRLAAGVAAFLCLTVAAASQGAPPADGVVNVRFGGDHNETRVVIELGHSAKARFIDDGASGHAVVLALPGIAVGAARRGAGLGLVSSWSLDSAAGAARLSLTLNHSAQIRRRFLLPPSDGVAVYRYVIDLDGPAGSAPAAPASAPAARAAGGHSGERGHPPASAQGHRDRSRPRRPRSRRAGLDEP